MGCGGDSGAVSACRVIHGCRSVSAAVILAEGLADISDSTTDSAAGLACTSRSRLFGNPVPVFWYSTSCLGSSKVARPVSARKISSPRDHMSAAKGFASVGSPMNGKPLVSGAMKLSFPRTVVEATMPSARLLRPRSATLTHQLSGGLHLIMMFCTRVSLG